jgi:hypothetical protein
VLPFLYLFLCLFANLCLFSGTVVLNPDASVPSLESADTTDSGHLPSIVGESSSKNVNEKANFASEIHTVFFNSWGYVLLVFCSGNSYSSSSTG